MSEQLNTTIQVDAQAAEILRQASLRARANGETLGAYLRHTLPSEALTPAPAIPQRLAWESFVSGMTEWAKANLPPGYVADDSRDSTYDDRT